ncbi:hypothetical protein JOL79_06975 [Microbispora sp. RL4-1S]|uniref:Uncharacterized protein n=1 Tax=Microbispora oryzae TaxID=2806554 RepID=A0A941AH02_9ACTN|nr:hypothetical protein [Microbispora oryzae]MBP2703541.1 hypothetical protein [Microbispora oryzae]
MARCGCSGTCACNFAAGPGITLAGTGSTADPVVISATPAPVDCDDVRPCISAGPGAAYNAATGVISARISTDPGNALINGGDGGLYTPNSGGGGGLTSVAVQDTPCIDLGGLGTAGQPLTAAPIVDAAAGNLLACTPSGMRAALAVGACGLSGNGSAASPLAAKVQAWPYTCPVDANAGGVYCDSTGNLRGEPRGKTFYQQDSLNQTLSSTAVPSGFDNVIVTRNLSVTNPDPCRPMFCIFEVEVDVDFDLPAASGAAYGITTDEMAYFANRGSTAASDVHCQTTKVYNRVIAAGATLVEPLEITMGRGSGGATYNRIQHFIRCFGIIL